MWHTIFHITWGVTGGSLFALFITVSVITFIAVFDGFIILIATDWFDVSGFYLSCWDTVGNLLDFPTVRSCIFQLFFLSKWKDLRHFAMTW